MTNIDTTGNMQTNGAYGVKSTDYKYLEQTIAMGNRKKRNKVSIRITAGSRSALVLLGQGRAGLG